VKPDFGGVDWFEFGFGADGMDEPSAAVEERIYCCDAECCSRVS